MHEVQVARVAPSAVTHPAWFAPAGQPYLVIPWDRLGADGGTFRWRVRPKDTDAWSPWRAFRYAPTALARVRNDGALRVGIEQIQHRPSCRGARSRAGTRASTSSSPRPSPPPWA